MRAMSGMNKVLGAALIAAPAVALAFAGAPAANADGPNGAVAPAIHRQTSSHELRVPLDQAVALRLSAPAEGVAIGNPSIAGVSIQNERLLFVTGRSYGTTNLVIVGPEGQTVYSGRITVTADEANVVMVTRGAETTRLDCTPLCRPRPDIGDASASYSQTAEQIQGRASAAGNAR